MRMFASYYKILLIYMSKLKSLQIVFPRFPVPFYDFYHLSTLEISFVTYNASIYEVLGSYCG